VVHRLISVLHDIEKHLGELRAISSNEWQAGVKPFFYRYALLRRAVAFEQEHFLKNFVDVHRR
jgi:hypothetical protein